MGCRLVGIARWSVTGLLAVVLVAWLASGHWFWYWQVRPAQDELLLMNGCIGLEHYYVAGAAMPGSGLDRRAGYRLVWWVSWISAPNVWQLKVPLWMFAALLGAGAVGAWAGPYARYRRLRATRCPSCAYDRAGLAADVRCPECGTVPAPAAT